MSILEGLKNEDCPLGIVHMVLSKASLLLVLEVNNLVTTGVTNRTPPGIKDIMKS